MDTKNLDVKDMQPKIGNAITLAALQQYAGLCVVSSTNMLNTNLISNPGQPDFPDYVTLNNLINSTKNTLITQMLAGAAPAPSATVATSALAAYTNLVINNNTGYHADAYAGSTSYTTAITALAARIVGYS